VRSIIAERLRDAEGRSWLPVAVLVAVSVLWTAALLAFSFGEGLLAWDFRFAYLPAADAVLGGDTPYPRVDDPLLEDQKGYVYPPQLVLATLPLAPLPVDVVAVLVGVGFLAMGLAVLRVLRVRDLRCYAVLPLWMPFSSGVLFANLSIPLALAFALAWRYRDRVWPPAVALGLAVSAKLLMWPMLVWTIATHRLRATVRAVAVGLGLTLAAWAAIGFAGLAEYPSLLRRLSEIQSENSYSLVGIASTLGLGEGAGRAATLVVGLGLLAWCAVLARRGDDVRSFTCAVGATLALSPIVWLHYLVVLVVPLAIARPRFSAIWLLPVLLWISPRPGYAEGYEALLPAIAATILIAVLLVRPGSPVYEVGGRATTAVSSPR
jgi:hypothetical protein